MSRLSTATKTIVATTRMNQKRPASLAATGPCGFKIEGEFSPQAARRIEDIISAEMIVIQRLTPRNFGILTSHFPKIMLICDRQPHRVARDTKIWTLLP